MKTQVLLTGLTAIAISGAASAAAVDLSAAGINHDFESPDLAGTDGGEQFNGTGLGAGWTVSGTDISTVGLQDPPTSFYGTQGPLPAPFNGRQFGYINLSFTDTNVAFATTDTGLLGNLAANTVYTLSIAVGDRGGSTFDVDYSIGLLAGGVEVGTFTAGNPGSGAILDLVYTLDTSLFPAGVGDDLQIQLQANGASGGFDQANFDNVRLDTASVPEPGSLALLGLGGLALLRRRRA